MKKNEQEEFESLLDIDKTRLDDEAENQPRLVWRYGLGYAKALRDVDEALAELKLVEAELDEVVRSHPEDFGLEKITEAAVKRAILRSKELGEAQKKLRGAQFLVNTIQAANKALDHRKTSLEMLDKQDARNYFSKPQQQVRTDSGRSIHRRPMKKKGKRE